LLVEAYNQHMTPLEKELNSELLAIYDKGSTIGYRATYFKRMLVTTNPRFYKGPVGTVRHLMIGDAGPGFQRLVEAGKLDWTVEWLIAQNPKFNPLFDKSPWVIQKAIARVRKAQIPN
jgi:hypothetical protein